MRVITGTARGRRLRTLPGEHTRPTAARVKEAIFSIIQFGVEGRRVLDLFAGSGQMGVEALSRGARAAVFVDSSPEALAVIRVNLELTGLTGRSTVVAGDALSYVRRRPEPFDIIFLDPPYAAKILDKTLEFITSVDILRPGGIIICETAADTPPSDLPPPYERGRSYRYGTQAVQLYGRTT